MDRRRRRGIRVNDVDGHRVQRRGQRIRHVGGFGGADVASSGNVGCRVRDERGASHGQSRHRHDT